MIPKGQEQRKLSLLQSVSWLSCLKQSVLIQLAECSRFVSFDTKAIVDIDINVDKYCYIVCQGEIGEVHVVDQAEDNSKKSGMDIERVKIHNPGDMFAEYESLCNMPYAVGYIALKRTLCLMIPIDIIVDIAHKNHKFQQVLIEHIQRDCWALSFSDNIIIEKANNEDGTTYYNPKKL